MDPRTYTLYRASYEGLQKVKFTHLNEALMLGRTQANARGEMRARHSAQAMPLGRLGKPAMR